MARDITRTAPWRTGDVLLAATACGLLAGAIEVVAAEIRLRLMGRMIYMGPELIWQVPLADVIIFGVVAGLLIAIGARWPRCRSPMVVGSLFAGMLCFAALLLTEKIHVIAEAVLAAGLGVGVGRGVARQADAARRILRRAAPAGLVLLGLAALGQQVGHRLAERRSAALLPSARAGSPNILLLVLDTVRAWNLGFYGYGRPTTPKLDAWAKRGFVFERALAPAPWTTPSHAVMFTGRHPTELSVTWEAGYDGKYPTLAEVLGKAGYETAGFAGNYLNLGRGSGLAAGFQHYEDYPFEPIQFFRSTTLLGRLLKMDRAKALIGRRRMIAGLVGGDVNRRFLGWLDRHGQRPWFGFLNYFDAHGPYLPPVPYDTIYMGKPDPPVDQYWERLQRAYGPSPVPLPDLAEALDAYDGAITYLDLQVDSLLSALQSRGQLEHTIVVITSDHGELFGEHGVVTHGNNLYLPVLHVPLLVIVPGKPGGRIPLLASLADLPATLLDLSGVSDGRIPGHSFFAGSDTLFASLDFNPLIPKWPPAPVLRGPMATVVLDSLQYILNGDGQEELYHLGNDAWEVHNLIGLPEYQARLQRYRGALRALSARR